MIRTMAGPSDGDSVPRLDILVSSQCQPDAWDAYVARHPLGTVDHLWGWRAVFRQVFGHDSEYLVARRDDTIVGVLPLVLFGDPWFALRISNLVVVGLLFLAGYHWAKYVHANPWLTGFGLTGIGLALVAVATLLGG